MASMRVLTIVVCCTGALAAACSGGSVCDAAALEAALRDASDGSTVSVGACRVEGQFTVARGVTLRGEGPELTTIAGPDVVLVLEGAGGTIEGLRVESGAGHGILAVDASSVTVRDVEVRSPRGRAAIGIDGVQSVVLEDVMATGPVTRENAIDVPFPATEEDTALYGIALLDVPSARLDRVSVAGFGLGGVGSVNSDVTWNDGSVSMNLGLGFFASGGTIHLERVTVSDTLRGFRGEPTLGVAIGGGADVTTVDVSIERTQGGFGLIQDGGSSSHDGLVASEAAAGAIRAQRTTAFVLRGASLQDNDYGGLIAVDAGGLVVEDSAFASTRTATRMRLDTVGGSASIGDGVQLVRPLAGTAIRRTTFAGNERAGMLLDLGGADLAAVELDGVEASAEGASFGCVAQNGTVPAGWDSGVTRTGAAAANDAAFGGGLDIEEIVGPSHLPPSDALVGIVGPSH